MGIDMADDVSIFQWALGGISGAGAGAYLYLSAGIGKVYDALAEHKQHVADNYSRKEDVTEIKRKIDENTKETVKGFADVKKDISDLAVSIATIRK